MKIQVQSADFDVAEELRALKSHPKVGAVAMFVGCVRDMNDGQSVTAMELEHYPGMTEKSLAQIVQKACSRWPLDEVTVIHRVGPLKPTDQIVFVGVASSHRQDAFLACEFIMDWLKTEAPFWKKESRPLGTKWVEAGEEDQSAKERWNS